MVASQRNQFCEQMEITHAIIFYDFKSGLNQQQCIDRLNSAFGNEAPSKTTVYDWFSEFNRGRNSLSDEFRKGRPSTAVPENIDAVRVMIEEDRHVTYREMVNKIKKSNTNTISPEIYFETRADLKCN